MDNSILIKKVIMDCPICDKVHAVEERKQWSPLIIDGETVFYEESYYRCSNIEDDENEFMMGSMINSNLANIRRAGKENMFVKSNV